MPCFLFSILIPAVSKSPHHKPILSKELVPYFPSDFLDKRRSPFYAIISYTVNLIDLTIGKYGKESAEIAENNHAEWCRSGTDLSLAWNDMIQAWRESR
jgi:hypothetical protein